jgi:hypothetical protein
MIRSPRIVFGRWKITKRSQISEENQGDSFGDRVLRSNEAIVGMGIAHRRRISNIAKTNPLHCDRAMTQYTIKNAKTNPLK